MITGAKQSCTMSTAVHSCRLRTGRSVPLARRTAIPDDVVRTRSGDRAPSRLARSSTRCSLVVSATSPGGSWGDVCARCQRAGRWPDIRERQTGQGGRQQGGDGGPAGPPGQGADQHPMAPRPMLQREAVLGVAVPRRPRRASTTPLESDAVGASTRCRPRVSGTETGPAPYPTVARAVLFSPSLALLPWLLAVRLITSVIARSQTE